MSLAYTPIGCSCLSRFRPSCTSFAAGSGRSRWSKRSAAAAFGDPGRLPADVPASIASGTRRAGSASACSSRRSSAARKIPMAVHRWVWRHRRLEQLARLLAPEAPAGRRPVAGDHRAGAQRLRAGALAGAVRGGDPRGRPGRAAARFPRRRPQPAPSALGLAGGRAARRGAVPALACSRRRPPTPGSGSSSPWSNAPRYTFTTLEPLPEPIWSSRTASRSRSTARARRADTVWRPARASPSSAPSTRSPPGCATAGTSSSCRRRSIRAGWTIKIGDASQQRPHRADPAPRADLGRRRR